ncbi:MAG: hypothetical protein FJ399_21825 [Verrucomicrobia bacterium]|nr:hypothetical protein [Verrucomicrobiota bacterium]
MTTRKTVARAAEATKLSEGNDGLDELKVSELQAKFTGVVGETTRSPNRTYLLRRIREAIAAAASAIESQGGQVSAATDEARQPADVAGSTAVGAEGVAPASSATPAESAEPAANPKLSKLDVPALQALYREIIGRDTRSTSRHYLVFKLQKAQKGRVPLGPRESRRKEGESFKVLPLRLEAGLVDQMDAAWRRQGLGSRMEMFRAALRLYFDGVGENALADLMTKKD